MLIAHVLPLSWYRNKLQNLSLRNCGLQIRQIWIQLITTCVKYCKRRCKKYASLIWTNWNSNWERSGPSWITSSLWQPSVSGVVDSQIDACFVHLFCNIVHMINWIDILQIWRPQLRWYKFWSFSNNAVVERAQWSFQVSQGSVETLFRWGGKRLNHVAAYLFRKLCARFHQNCPSFVGDITENIVVSFFRTHCILVFGWISVGGFT